MGIIPPSSIRNKQYHLVGAIFNVLNYVRHSIMGYKTPRPFSIKEFDRAINYDFSVVDGWLKYLRSYSKDSNPIKNKTILELGPGADLGIGIILLAMGVKKYIALDVNELVTSVPQEFYDRLFNQLETRCPDCDINYLKEQLNKHSQGKPDAINYIVNKDFRVSEIKDKIDIVFSQAAFEHFNNVEKTFQELSAVVKEDGVLVTEIDLRTHTRWIIDRDPLNIYRYSTLFWNLFKFIGSPNRVRVLEYKKLLEKNGWLNIEIEPLTVLENEYLKKVQPSLGRKYRSLAASEMRMLTIILMATRNNS